LPPTAKIRCLQLLQPGCLDLSERSLPAAGAGERLLRVTHCALCRTDAKMFSSGHRDLVLPRVLGHEICGRDESSGATFVVWPGTACGVCRQCQAGRENLCPQMRILGFHRDGGLAEWLVAPEASLLPVPPDLPGELACLAEPVACTLNALQQVKLCAGKKILIYGAGPVGLMMAIAAVKAGSKTWINDKNPSRLHLSRDLRNQLGIGVEAEESSEAFDVVINAAPAAETFSRGLRKLVSGGRYCLFSGLTDDVAMPISALNEIHYRQLQVSGAYGCTSAQMKQAVELIWQNQDRFRPLIARQIGLDEAAAALPAVLQSETMKLIVAF